MAENILKSLKDIIRLSGLDPAEFAQDWETNMRAVNGWLSRATSSASISTSTIPARASSFFQWNIEISYSWTGGDGSFWTDCLVACLPQHWHRLERAGGRRYPGVARNGPWLIY